MTRVAAIVPSLGVSPWAGQSLEALRAELARHAYGHELVWVHQGANPSPELTGPSERLLRLPEPVGFAAAVNRGFAAASGEIDLLLILNDDLMLEGGWLAELIARLESHAEAASAQGVNLRLEQPGLVDGCGIGWNRDWQAVQIRDGELAPQPDLPPFEIFGVSATAALYRVGALHAVAPAGALFDERLGSYYEDVALAVRLQEAGFTSLCAPRARARHAGQATTRRTPRARWRAIYRNRRLVAAELLGERWAHERRRIVARDRRDLVGRLLAFDIRAAAGIVQGLREARRFRPEPALLGSRRALAAAERLAVGSRA